MKRIFFASRKGSTGKFWVLTPLAGSLLFLLLYVVAALLYPGGSQADVHSNGFSWQHNYWCNLLNETAINGQYNRGRPIGIAAMVVLMLTLFSFWIIAAKLLPLPKLARATVVISGFVSMASLTFLSTFLHDAVINISGFFGLLAMAGVYGGIYRNKWFWLLATGFLNILLVGVNNYIYYSDGSLYLLPVVQKITFLSFLIWVCLVDVKLYLLS